MIAEKVLDSFPTYPIPEIKRLGRTLKQWRAAFLAYFDTGRANNGGTEAINGLIELHRRIARGFRNRDNYRLRTLLIGGGLAHPTSSRKSRFDAHLSRTAVDGRCCPDVAGQRETAPYPRFRWSGAVSRCVWQVKDTNLRSFRAGYAVRATQRADLHKHAR